MTATLWNMESPSDFPIPPDVHDRDSAAAFVRWCVMHVGLGYHPDTPFEDYVDDSGVASFSLDAANTLNELNERAFSFCDPYEVGLAEVRKQLNEQGLI